MTYNKFDAFSIEQYGKKLIGKTFFDVLNNANLPLETTNELQLKYSNKNKKGGLGIFLEEIYFGYKANNDSRPDFYEAGIELKVTPYEIKKNKEYKVGERLVLSMIGYNKPIDLNLYDSHLWIKMKKILLIFYFRDSQVFNSLNYRIDFVELFTPTQTDLKIIEQDYTKIASKIQEGRAHELSESDTMYLSACTKGATAKKSLTTQYYNSDVLAKSRAFAFKPSYMNSVLAKIMSVTNDESIVKNVEDLVDTTFEAFTLNKLRQHYGKTDVILCKQFEREYNNNKAQWIELAYRMLGISSNKADEFVKSNIVVKSIRIEENKSMHENISFPSFDFIELLNENWETSTLYTYFEETRFLFVIFRKQGDYYVFDKAKFWNMPISDLNGEVRECWEQTRLKIKAGITFTKKGKRILNDLPSTKDNGIMHVRPHAVKSAYILKDGTAYGNVIRDGSQLPDGQFMTKQCFWLNKQYVLDNIVLIDE